MRQLPLDWKQGSWTYTQVWREGDIAIYRQTHQDGPAERFEVIRVQHREERVFPSGQVQEAGEYSPGSASWGQQGWTCFNLTEARAVAATLATPPATGHPAPVTGSTDMMH